VQSSAAAVVIGWFGRLVKLAGAGLGWVAQHRKLALLGSGGLLVPPLLIAVYRLIVSLTLPAGASATVEEALQLLDEGSYHEARLTAMAVKQNSASSYQDVATAAYVLGMATAYSVDASWQSYKSESYRIAARYLAEARQRGFPPERRAEATYQLGRCLFLSDQYADCRPVLAEALTLTPRLATSIHRMLTVANLRDATPNLEEALKHNRAYLADRLLEPERRQQALLQQAEILYRLGRLPECREVLNKIDAHGPAGSELSLMRGRMLLGEAERMDGDAQLPSAELSEKHQKLRQAIHTFREALASGRLGSRSVRRATYLIGVAHQQLGELDTAVEQLSRTQKLYHGTPEAVAAGMRLGDVLLEQGEVSAAVASYLRSFVAAGHPDGYSNPWLSLDEFRQRMTDAFRALLDAEQFAEALRLLRAFEPMFSEMHTLEFRAETYRTWAQWFVDQGADGTESEVREFEIEARRRFRRAGLAHARLARMRRATRLYPDDVWNSATNLLRGHDYENGLDMLSEYLEIEQRKRRPQALLLLGKTRLSMGEVEGSLEAFGECIDFFPRDAAVYEARNWAAKAYASAGKPEEAKALLKANLQGDSLTPASREWRDALFQLGRLTYEQGDYREAIQHLEEAVARYPEAPEAVEGQYLVAEAYRLAAVEPQRRLEEANIESVRIAERRKVKSLLSSALKNYEALRTLLNRRADERELSEANRIILRNCYFSIGAVLYDLHEYEKAIIAYSDASTRYQNEPVVLEAFVQIASCHRRLGRRIEARGALEQAKVVLQQLPEDLEFRATTNYSRDQWISLLDQMIQW